MDVTRPIGLCFKLVDQMRTRSPGFGSDCIDFLLSFEPRQRSVSRVATTKDNRAAERFLVGVEVAANVTVVAASNRDL